MRFTEAIAGLAEIKEVCGDAEICRVSIDSRTTDSGSVFVCMPGSRADSHSFIEDAWHRGTRAYIVTREDAFRKIGEKSGAAALANDTEEVCWRLCKKVYGNPSENLQVIGVTGTNGKTTVAWLLYQLLARLGKKTAYFGTLGARIGEKEIATDLTTPFPPQINELLVRAKDEGVQTAVMEVSSHALAQKRVDGLEFDVAVFTNLTQDHLDFHKDLDSYFAAKRRLFDDLESDKNLISVINADDDFGKMLLLSLKDTISFGKEDADLLLRRAEVSLGEIIGDFEFHGDRFGFRSKLGGAFNVQNCLAALAAGIASGEDLARLTDNIKFVAAAPGRFESLPGNDFQVIVDYAHTPDALEKLLLSVRELAKGKLITVFGCGGDRDKGKRPKMGAAASSLSDVVYITSDNPRTEEPAAIIADILPGVVSGTATRVMPDRRRAIFEAICEAQKGDTVVIAGKGHEDYQILGTTKVPFDDKNVALEAIQEKAACV